MFWIQESKTSGKPVGYKQFYADFESDIIKLPRLGIEGTQESDTNVENHPVGYGSECLCLETGELFILSREDNEWKKV